MVDLGLFFWEFSTVNPKASGSVCNPSSSEGGWLSHIYSLEFLSIFAVLTNIRRNIKVVLICISLLARDNGWALWDFFFSHFYLFFWELSSVRLPIFFFFNGCFSLSGALFSSKIFPCKCIFTPWNLQLEESCPRETAPLSHRNCMTSFKRIQSL